MKVIAIETKLSNKGVTTSGRMHQIVIDSFLKRSLTRPFRSSALETSSGTCTSAQRIPENVVLQINKEWYKPLTHEAGMSGRFKTYLTATTDPRV